MGRGSRGRPSWTRFKAYLQERIEAARPRWIPAVVLLREIARAGYGAALRSSRRSRAV